MEFLINGGGSSGGRRNGQIRLGARGRDPMSSQRNLAVLTDGWKVGVEEWSDMSKDGDGDR